MSSRRQLIRVLALAVATAAAPACGVRAPRSLDVAALVRQKGAVEARQTLAVHVLDAPRDVQARLALAKLADEAGRPSEAIEQLEAVLRLGGPLGTRWHADDRARLARLLAARGRIRLARESPTALGDLKRARGFGAAVTDEELARARAAAALADLRHVDAEVRERGRAAMARLADDSFADHAWLGAKHDPVPRNRGLWGVWLWDHGARRAAWEALRDWHATTPVRGGALQAAYLRAYAWWTPYDGPPPPASDLVGPERCRFAAATDCALSALLATTDRAALASLAWSAGTRTSAPDDAAAWAAVTLARALHGDGSWGAQLAGHVDLAALDRTKLPAYARAIFAHLAGAAAPGTVSPATPSPDAPGAASPDVPDAMSPAAISHRSTAAQLTKLPPGARLVAAAGLALDGASVETTRTALGDLADTDDGRALLAIVAPPSATPTTVSTTASSVSATGSLAEAIAAYMHARGGEPIAIGPIVAGYARDPGVAERLARDAIAEAGDAAAAQAAVGMTFSLLGDPARARSAWQAAVELSPEPVYVRGLAEAIARAGDPDAAMVYGTTAAAASGDPAVVWIELARALAEVGAHVQALEAARYAIDLAGADTIAEALEVAIASSHALGRDAQASELALRRTRVAPLVAAGAGDPTDVRAALAAFTEATVGDATAGDTPDVAATDAAVSRLWTAARWNPRDVASRAKLLVVLDDADVRHATVVHELVGLAGDRDSAVGRAAVAAIATMR